RYRSSCLTVRRPLPGDTYSSRWAKYAEYGARPGLPHEFVEEAASGITAGSAANRMLYGEEEPAIQVRPRRDDVEYSAASDGFCMFVSPVMALTEAQVLPPSALRFVNMVFLVVSATVVRGRPDESVATQARMLST